MKCCSDTLWKWRSSKGTCRCHTCFFCCLLPVMSGCAAKKEPPKAKPLVPVTVATSTQKNVPVQIRAIGNIEPLNSVAVKAQINGQVAKVHFREGTGCQERAAAVHHRPSSLRSGPQAGRSCTGEGSGPGPVCPRAGRPLWIAAQGRDRQPGPARPDPDQCRRLRCLDCRRPRGSGQCPAAARLLLHPLPHRRSHR